MLSSSLLSAVSPFTMTAFGVRMTKLERVIPVSTLGDLSCRNRRISSKIVVSYPQGNIAASSEP
jgi:hypothetical protein